MSAPVDPPESMPQPVTLAQLPRGPFILFGLMTLATVGGPILMILTLWGGAGTKWPPDRPIEWVVVVGTTGSVLILMVGCLALGFRTRKMLPRPGRERSVITRANGEVDS